MDVLPFINIGGGDMSPSHMDRCPCVLNSEVTDTNLTTRCTEMIANKSVEIEIAFLYPF